MSRVGSAGRDERGVVMIQAMILVAIIALLGAAAVQRGSTLARDNIRERAQLRALLAAEGGLAHARHALRTNQVFDRDTILVGRCSVVVTVTRLTDAQWEITARAACPTRGRQSVTVGLSEGLGAESWYRTLR